MSRNKGKQKKNEIDKYFEYEYATSNSLAIIINEYLEDCKLDKLMELIRLKKREFYPKNDNDLSNILNSTTLITILDNGRFDKDYFTNVIENKEKLKILVRYLESIINYLDEDFEKHNDILLVQQNLKSLIFFFSRLLPDTKTILSKEEEKKFENQKVDKRIRTSVPKNNERLKALIDLCPEFINRLNNLSKEEKMQAISLVTAVNKDDAYKKVFTAYRRRLTDIEIEYDDIDYFDLKTKLNKT